MKPDHTLTALGLALALMMSLIAAPLTAQAQVTLPTITITADGDVTEGTPVAFTLMRTGDTADDLAVRVSVSETAQIVTAQIVAAANKGRQMVTFAAGSATATLAVPTRANTTWNGASDVHARLLANASLYTLGDPASATARVIDDEVPVGWTCNADPDGIVDPTDVAFVGIAGGSGLFANATQRVEEGEDIVIEVRRTSPFHEGCWGEPDHPWVVNLRIAQEVVPDGTSPRVTVTEIYERRVEIHRNQRTFTVRIPTIDNETPGGESSIDVSLVRTSETYVPLMLLNEKLRIVLFDNDQSVVFFDVPCGAPLTVLEDVGTVDVSLRVEPTVGFDFSVLSIDLPGSASDGNDYVGSDGTTRTHFPAGTERGSISVGIVDDRAVEATESFELRLFDNGLPSQVELGTCTSQPPKRHPRRLSVEILDDDRATISFGLKERSVIAGQPITFTSDVLEKDGSCIIPFPTFWDATPTGATAEMQSSAPKRNQRLNYCSSSRPLEPLTITFPTHARPGPLGPKALRVRIESDTDARVRPEHDEYIVYLDDEGSAGATGLLPSAPQHFTATSGNQGATLVWEPPASDGGRAITGYEYRYAAGSSIPYGMRWTAAGTERSTTVRRLQNETLYTFEVRAVNRVGSGEAARGQATPTTTHYAQGFTTGAHTHGYTLTSVELDFTSAFVPTVEVWAADAEGRPHAVVWRLDPRRGSATVFDAAAGTKLDAATTYFVFASFGGTPATTGAVFAAGTSPSGWTIASDRYARADGHAGAWALSGAGQPLRIRLAATSLAAPGAAAAEPADAAVSWKASLTVGNLMRRGYREWERGYRRQWCMERQVEDDPEHIEDRTTADWCYGRIADRDFVVDGTTYELEGVYHYVAERNDQLNVDFTAEVDLAALAGREFVINGVTFAVNDRQQGLAPGPFAVRVTFSEDVTGFEAADITVENAAVVEDSFTAVKARTWTARIAPVASGPVAVSVPADAAQAGQTGNTASAALAVEADLSVPAVTVTRTAPAPVSGPFSVRVTFSKPVTGFALDDLTIEGGTATGLVSPTGETWHDVLVAPSAGATDVAVTVPAGVVADLAGRPNAASETLRIAVAGLTASFHDAPRTHDGSAAFTVELRFSEEIAGLSYRTLRDSAFTVTHGRVTGARRLEAGKNRRWQITVEPEGLSDVTVSLPAATDCAATGAICTPDGTKKLAAASLTVRVAPLTAAFHDVPPEHDGETAFIVELRFSEHVAGLSYRTLRDSAFTVTHGRVTKAGRLERGQNRRWQITVEPDGLSDVTVSLPATTDCAAAGAICASAARMLSNDTTATVPGPVALSVADARAEEGTDATIDFTVTLSRAASAAVTVDYATADGSATAGADYTAASGTLVLAAGERVKTVAVAVLDDSEDEGEETLTLTLSNAVGARIADGEATGTIRNTDAMPKAWLGRFGRTVAEQVMEAVEGRLAASRAPGVEVTVAGARMGGSGSREDAGAREEEEARATLADWLQDEAREQDDPRRRSRAVTQRELLTGSSFALTGEPGGGGNGVAALWGRGAVTRFDGRAETGNGDLTLDGEVVSGMLGADGTRGPWTVGLLLSHFRGSGSYRGASGGKVESVLTGAFPYGRYALHRRLSVWGAAGYGAGWLTLTPEGQKPIGTDMDLMMGAVGLRGVAVEAPAEGGVELALKSDALAVRTRSKAVRGGAGGGNLAAATADVTRLRLGLEGTWRGLTLGGGTLAPRLEVGVRHDGGDAETGFGVDVGGGLAWSDPKRGLSAELRARGLLTYESRGFRDRGVSGALTWEPGQGTGRGPKLTLTQTVGGSASGGADALLSRGTLAGLAANDDGEDDGADDLRRRRLEIDFDYGFSAFGDRFTWTPQIGVGLSDAGRDYRLGWRLTRDVRDGGSLELSLDATRRESVTDNDAPEHGVGLRLTARW